MRSITTQSFHKSYLLVTAVIVGSFGPVFSLATLDGGGDLARWTLNLLNGPGGDPEIFEGGTTQFLSALTGGFLFGMGVMIFCFRTWVYDSAPEQVRRSVVVGLLAWFVLDSAGSFASKNAWNVLFNVCVIMLAIGPMWRPADAPKRRIDQLPDQ